MFAKNLDLQFYYKETPAQVFSEFCEIFKNTNFVEHLQTVASVILSDLKCFQFTYCLEKHPFYE